MSKRLYESAQIAVFQHKASEFFKCAEAFGSTIYRGIQDSKRTYQQVIGHEAEIKKAQKIDTDR